MKKIISTLGLMLLLTGLTACSDNGGDNGGDDGKPVRPYKELNLVTFGNSITYDENSWAYQTSTRLDFGNLYNGAYPGAIWYKRQRTSNGKLIETQNYNDPDFAGISNESNTSTEAFQRIINNCAVVHIQKYLDERRGSVPDVIILSYGTNDAYDDSTIGDVEAAVRESDPDKVDMFTMAGGLKWCLVTLRTEFPEAKIYVALPLQARDDAKNEGNLKKMTAIKAVCASMSVPTFDCYNESGITQANEAQYLRDGLHPNAAGQTVHADYIILKLSEAAKQNKDK